MNETVSLSLPTLHDTQSLGANLAAILEPGDCLLLSGEIGAGKTALSRAIIQSALNRVEDVPSPTFTLVQTYETPIGEIWHCDLYRLSDPDEVFELGIETAMDDAICLIEWPDRLGDLAPTSASRLTLSATDTGHHITMDFSPDLLLRYHGS